MKKLLISMLATSLSCFAFSVNANDGINLVKVLKNGGEMPKNHPALEPKISPNDDVLGGELFQPTLVEFKKTKVSNDNTPSGLLIGDEPPPNRVSRLQNDLGTQIEEQYFFKKAQHSKLEAEIADDMRITTGGKGDIWVSTRIDKNYPVQWNSPEKKSKHQCVDVAMRMTHDEVPLTTASGVKYVTFWQDFKKQVCQSKDED